MHKTLLIPFLLLSNILMGQIKVSGKISETKNTPVPGVSISIDGSYDGSTSDSIGNYSFSTMEKGKQILIFSASGYREVRQEININAAPIVLNISMKEEITELKAVVISAGSFEASDTKRATALSPLDIVTTASANGDITNAIKTLPGTQQVGESEGLFVRGGTATETKFFIDGGLVNNFFYSSEPGQATRGRFNPFLFKGTVFSSGGYSALYGQALSSVILMESIDLPDKTSADFGISYLAANAGIQKLSKNKKSSWGITYSYTNLSLVYGLIKQKFDYFRVPVIHQADYNFRIKTSKTGMLKYYGSLSHTDVGFRNQDVDSLSLKNAFGLKNFNNYNNLSWKEKLGHHWRIQSSITVTNNRDKIKIELQDDQNNKEIITGNDLYANKNFNLLSKGFYGNGKVVLEKNLGGLSAIRFGSEYNYSDEKSTFASHTGDEFNQHLRENLISAFAETDIYITNKLAAKIGSRAEHSDLLNKWNVAPRISLAYKFKNNGQASFAYGLFYQNPENKYLPSINALHFSKATHYILQYQKISTDYTFRTEIFYKKYDDLIKTGSTNNSAKAINNDGFGDAKGIEFFWRDRKSIKSLDYWISYSYLDTKRDFLNYPFALRPSFATKHTASIVMKKFVLPLKSNFNASYTFATGRPYYNLSNDGSNNLKITEQGHTKNYNDLSLSINYLPSIGKKDAKAFTVFVLSVTNVLGFNNVYSYNFSANGKNKIAVIPPAKRFVYLGCFISLGIDRTEDAINNHL
ncbi:MAG: TonB-dependent receptor [Ginsengibacter sp.]